MKEKLSIDDFYIAQLDAWEEFLIEVLHSQSNSLRSGLKCIDPGQSDGGLVSQWIEFSHKQLENWTEIEQELLIAIFHAIKEIDPGEGIVSEAGTKAAHRFFDHWENRAGKAFETHKEFYSLIFPWNDGEAELEDRPIQALPEAIKEPVEHNISHAA